MLKIKEVLTEYRKNPICIDNEKPLFGWKYEQSENTFQSSYRVLVASSKRLLATGNPDFWDSGEVLSSAQFGIEYEGKKLTSCTVYYVKVIVKDGKQQRSESDIFTFETGLLNESDWKGKWVSMPVNFQGGALAFRKDLEIPSAINIERARVYVCAVGYHELYFNGVKVEDYVLHPPVSDYSKTVYYSAYDITNLVAEKNAIGVLVGHGWLGDRKLLAQINVYYKDGTVFEDHTANCHGWWMSGSPIVSESIYGGETYDARREDEFNGWATAGYKSNWENGWMYTFLVPPVAGEKRACSIEPIRVCATNKIKSKKRIDRKNYLIDAGANISGWLKITASGARGAKIVVKYAEDILNGRINRINLRSAACTDTYIFRGKGEETYAPRFTYHGFRYAEIEIFGNVRLKEIVSEHVHTDVRPVGEFCCDNDVINKLHENAVRTEANNIHSIMTDCPQRDERLGWLNDLSTRIYQTVNNFSMENMLPKIIKDISETQSECGEIADTAPFFTGSRPADPASIAYILFALKSYRLYGNARIIKEEYNNLKAWVDSLLNRQNGYIMDYTYYNDWVAPAIFEDVHTDGIFVSTVFLYWHLVCLTELAEIADKPADKVEYAAHAEKCRAAIREKFFDGNNFASGTQCENSMPLNLGLCDKHERQGLAKNIADDILDHGKHSTCGNQGYRHMFYALSEEGYNDLLFETLINPDYPGWGYMIAQGATSVWERWEKKMEYEMHSFNHPMFASYDGWLYNCVGGIRVADDAVASDKFVIKPKIVSALNKVYASVETLRGKVSCLTVKKAGGYTFNICVPTNSRATVILPFAVVKMNGKKCNGKTFNLPSGTYCFNTRL